MNEVILAVVGSGALSAVISGIFTTLNTKKRQKDGVAAGVQQLMYDRIKYLCKYHISRGRIASNDLEDLERMHTIYHNDLDGNGYLDDLMKKVRNLEVVPMLPDD